MVVKRGDGEKEVGKKRRSVCPPFFSHLIHLFPSEKEEEDVKSLSAPFSTPTVSVLSPCIQIGEFPLMAQWRKTEELGGTNPTLLFPPNAKEEGGKTPKALNAPKERKEGRKRKAELN